MEQEDHSSEGGGKNDQVDCQEGNHPDTATSKVLAGMLCAHVTCFFGKIFKGTQWEKTFLLGNAKIRGEG